MRIKKIVIHHIKIPFKQPFKHASAERLSGENIVVRCVDEDGLSGWGETIAREYVTGETTEDTIKRYKNIPKEAWKKKIGSVEDITDFLEKYLAPYNVAQCGMEIALLDLLSRKSGLSISDCLSKNLSDIAKISQTAPFFYGGAIGLNSIPKTIVNALKMRLYNFKKVKLKLERNLKQDLSRLFWTKLVLGGKIDLRVDANEAWDMEYASKISSYLKKYSVSAVEQPFKKKDFSLNKKFTDQTGITVILDESMCYEKDARAVVENIFPAVFCIKLPKTGGFCKALKLIKIAHENNLSIQVSCQVGETAILSCAGRHLARLTPNLRYLEGSFDRYLLKENISTEDISFGYGGKADMLDKPGLGIDIDHDKLDKITLNKITVFSNE